MFGGDRELLFWQGKIKPPQALGGGWKNSSFWVSTIRDRTVQMATKLVVEGIFEADFNVVQNDPRKAAAAIIN